jgi:hypothetical protein
MACPVEVIESAGFRGRAFVVSMPDARRLSLDRAADVNNRSKVPNNAWEPAG